jgi:hypothetical protein
MVEFSLELYRSRTAEIKAQRAEALAAYETAALASALDPAAGGQVEARAAIADLDTQQEALDAAYAKFTRDAQRKLAEADYAKWSAAGAKVDEIAAEALQIARERLPAVIEAVEEVVALYRGKRGEIQSVCRDLRPSYRDRRPGDIAGGRYDAYRDMMRGGDEDTLRALNAAGGLKELLRAFARLADEAHDSLRLAEPHVELETELEAA